MRDKQSRVLLALLTLAIVIGSGCEDEQKKSADVIVEPQAAKEVAPTGPLVGLEAPEAIVAYGGIDKPADLAAHASELLSGSPELGAKQLESAVSGLAVRYGLKDGKGLDPSKPARFAIVDPKAFEEPFVVAVGMTSRDELIKSLPEKHQKDDSGNAYSYVTATTRAVFVNFVDDWAVFSGAKEIFGAHKPFFVKLIGSTIAGDGGGVIEVAHITRLYATELDQAMNQATKNVASNAQFGGEGMTKMIDWVKSIGKDLDQVVITANAAKAGGVLKLDARAKAGSELEKSLKKVGARNLEPMLSKLPPDAAAAVVASFDPDSAQELLGSLASWSLQLMGNKTAEEPEYGKAMLDYWKGSTGEMAMAAHKLDEKLRVSMVVGVRDADTIRGALKVMRKLYTDETFAKRYAAMGIKMDYKPEAYKVGTVPVDTVTASLIETPAVPGGGDKAKPEANLKKAMGQSAALFAELMSQHVAITKDRQLVVYGKDSKKVMESWIEGKVPGGLASQPGVKRALGQAAPGLFLMIYGSPLSVAQALQGQPISASPNGLAVTVGATDGVLHLVIDVPSEQTTELTQLFAGLTSALLQQ